MKLLFNAILILTFSLNSLIAQENCLQKKNLIKLDSLWEKAQFNSNTKFLDSLLIKDFIWVHNNAKTIDNKDAVLNRAKRYLKNNIKYSYSRISKNVTAIIFGKTGVVNGFTIVQKNKDSSPITYNFMRTYTEKKGKCVLVANHTMAVDKTKW